MGVEAPFRFLLLLELCSWNLAMSVLMALLPFKPKRQFDC